MRRIYLLLALLVLANGEAFSQDWTAYTAAHGLPEGRVDRMVFDPDGVLWAASSAGLVRYDGGETRVYTDNDGFPFSAVNTMSIQPNRNVWVAARREMFHSGEKERVGGKWIEQIARQYPYNGFKNITETPDGVLWAGDRSNGYLWRYNGVFWDAIPGVIIGQANVLGGPDGSVWVGAGDNVKRYRDGAWSTVVSFGKPVTTMTLAPDNTMWTSSAKEMVKVVGNRVEPLSFPSAETYGKVYGAPFYIGPDGEFWFFGGEDLVGYDGSAWVSYPVPQMNTMARSSDGTIWVGTKHSLSPDGSSVWAGSRTPLLRYDGSAWTAFGEEVLGSDLGNGGVLDIAIAPNGDMWCAAPPGVVRFDGSIWRRYTTQDGLVNDWISAVSIRPNGEVWLAGDYGISRFDGAGFTNYTVASGLVSNKVRDIAFYLNDVWAGSDKGVSRFDGSSWSTFTTEDGLASNDVQTMLADSRGSIWFWTQSGISRYNENGWKSFIPSVPARYDSSPLRATLGELENGEILAWWGNNRLVINDEGVFFSDFAIRGDIHSVSFTSDGVAWIGAGKGLWKMDRGADSPYKGMLLKAPLPELDSPVVTVDRQNRLWVGTDSGIYSLLGMTVAGFWDAADGMTGPVLDITATPDSSVLAATAKGLFRFNGAGWDAEVTSVELGAAPRSIFFTGDNRMIVSGDFPRTGKLYESKYARFDGEKWDTWSNGPAPSSRTSATLAVNSQGEVWRTSEDGFAVFTGLDWQDHARGAGLPETVLQDSTLTLLFDQNDSLWVYTRTGMYRRNGDRWESRSIPLIGLNFSSLFAPDGSMTVYTNSSGLMRHDGSEWTSISESLHQNMLPSAFLFGPDNSTWLGFDQDIEGIYRFSGNSWQQYALLPDMPMNTPVTALAVSAKGEIYAADSVGIHKVSSVPAGEVEPDVTFDESWTHFSFGKPALDLAVSNDDLWWTTGSELYRFRLSDLSNSLALRDSSITEVEIGPDGEIWILRNGGLAFREGDAWVTVTSEGLPGPLTQFGIDGRGTIWAITGNDVAWYDGETWSTHTVDYRNWVTPQQGGFAVAWAEDISIGRDGEAYILAHIFESFGGNTHVHRLAVLSGSGGSFVQIAPLVQYSTSGGNINYRRSLHAVSERLISVGAEESGGWSFDGQSWTVRFALDNSLLAAGSDGSIWITPMSWMEKRVIHQTGETLTEYPFPATANVMKILSSGMIWAGTSVGLSRFLPDVLSVDDNAARHPEAVSITGNSPNPFNPSTTISFTLPSSGPAELTVYSVTGQKVRTLLSGRVAAGAHSSVWNGKDDAGNAVSSGVYIARLRAGKTVSSHKMLLMK